MKALYPTSHHIPDLSDEALALKIARHSPCSICTAEFCSGLRPPNLFELVPDSDELFEGSYLSSCRCGHEATDHGADLSVISRDEFKRRGRVAVRIDELLQDDDRLLDFDYTNDDIESLRQQMTLPEPAPDAADSPSSDILGSLVPSESEEKGPLSPASSFLSEAFDGDGEPPTKRRRVSYSSLSSDSLSSEDDEDKPLARARADADKPAAPARSGKGRKGGKVRAKAQRSGKGPASKSKGHTAPAHKPPPTEAERAEMERPPPPAAAADVAVKVEDKMDEGQLSRLVTGVTVDAGAGATSAVPGVKPEKPSVAELRQGIIRIVPVENDNQPRSLVILTGLKTLFQRQLPKMPREYIARLVYDSNSKCLAIVKRGYKVVGGICYRPFPQRKFAEIVFFATASVDQVKGYGSMLMDHFKAHIRKTYPDMFHFLTYADNYAVGYFKKQGFTKDITLDRAVWAGYIKDYEGGTIMQCTMLPKVDYTQTRDIVARQREAILEKIRERSRSHIVYPGLDDGLWAMSDGPLDPKQIPGLRESGWTPAMAECERPSARSPEHAVMEKLLSELQNHTLSFAFQKPVNKDEVLDYYDVIKEPMDLSTMEHKLDTNQYPNLDAFLADAKLIFDNCRTYNAEGSSYHRNATKLEKFLKDQVAALNLKREDS